VVTATNPFRPTAGVSPPELIGRESVLEQFAEAMEAGPGHPSRLALVSGQRGVGKTVLLNEIGDTASRLGWHVINLTASPGLLHRVEIEAGRLLRDEDPPRRNRITGVSVAGVGGLTFDRSGDQATDTRGTLTLLTDQLGKRGSGLMVTLDEVHAGPSGELRELAHLAQHLAREDRQFILVMAGLPSAVSGLLSDDSLTFIRRAERFELATVDVLDVEIAFSRTVQESGRSIDADQCRAMARASRGYPFLIQLIGFHVWKRAIGGTIDDDDVARGIDDALERMGVLVHEQALKDLSPADLRFLRAMAEDAGDSRVLELSARLAKDRYWVNNYRRRLIAARVIESSGRGRVRFAIPYLRDYLLSEDDRLS
jgi:hypothetical protein